MNRFTLYITLLCAIATNADTFRDSVTVQTDTLGPIHFEQYFFAPQSIAVTSDTQLPAWRYFVTDGAVRFESPIPQNTTLIFTAERLYGDLRRSYNRFKPLVFDSTKQIQSDIPGSVTAAGSSHKLSVSGEKSIGIQLGQGGEFTMDQSMDVKIFGKISDSTELSANLSDRSTSLEGDTKEIGEIDRMFLMMNHPRRQLIAGDLAISSDTSGLLREQKSPKGLSGTLKTRAGEITGFAGISGHRLAVEYLSGISGIQAGAYKLKGNGEPGQILPIEGTVELTVQGKKLTEGVRDDFTIDYTIGEVRFNPKQVIIDGDIIEIRYRYREYNFSKFVAGTGWKFSRDSVISVRSTLFGDFDNRNSASIILTDEDRQAIAAGGDLAPQILSGRKIHPNDVPIEAARNRIYQLLPDSSGYRWEPNPLSKAQVHDLFLVAFTIDNNGTYLPFTAQNRQLLSSFYPVSTLDSAEAGSRDSLFLSPVFFAVPAGMGTHSAFRTAPLAEQLIQGEVETHFSPSDQLNISTVIAGKARDRNRDSDKDDSDNNSGGFTGKLHLSSPTERQVILAADGDFSYAGSEFSSTVGTMYDRLRTWGIRGDSLRFSTAQGALTTTIRTIGSISFGGGQSQVEQSNYSTIATSTLRITPDRPISSNYTVLLRKAESYNAFPGRRQSIGISLKQSKLFSQATIEEEWLQRSELLNRGHLKGDLLFDFTALGLKESFEHKRLTSGDSTHRTAEEYGTHTLWKQELNRAIRDRHNLKITTSVLSQTGEKEGVSILLSADKQSRYLENRAATDLSYSVNSENVTARRWQYRYVGEGVGTHVRDSLTGEFLPAPFGDYIAEEIQLSGSGEKKMVRNGLNYRWSWTNRSQNRISDGFRLEGALTSQEDISPAGDQGSALIPMIPSLAKITEDTINYSAIGYTQTAGWSPPKLSGFSTSISSSVHRKEDQENLTRHLEGNGSVRQEFSHIHAELRLRGTRERRNQLLIRDGSFEPIQEFPIRKVLTPFIEEIAGLTALNDSTGYYLGARPGIRVKPSGLGSAELSYTAAKLVYDGILIYPMAKDFQPGMNHRIYLTLNLSTKKYLHFTGFFRGDYSEKRDWRFTTSLRAAVKF